MEIGCRAVRKCLEFASLSERDIDLFVLCSSTGYSCPDIASRLIGHMGFRSGIQRAPILGLGCGGALPSLQRASDFVRTHIGQIALVLTVEICSACYYRDDTLETVIGNAICADGAAAALLIAGAQPDPPFPEIVDFESFIYPEHLGSVGFEHRDGKLRIVLGSEVRQLAPSLIEGALCPLLARNNLRHSDIPTMKACNLLLLLFCRVFYGPYLRRSEKHNCIFTLLGWSHIRSFRGRLLKLPRRSKRELMVMNRR